MWTEVEDVVVSQTPAAVSEVNFKSCILFEVARSLPRMSAPPVGLLSFIGGLWDAGGR